MTPAEKIKEIDAEKQKSRDEGRNEAKNNMLGILWEQIDAIEERRVAELKEGNSFEAACCAQKQHALSGIKTRVQKEI